MIWACFSWYGRSEICFVANKVDAVKYVSMLEDYLLPFIEKNHPRSCSFQQDNASAHTAKYTDEFFRDEEILVLDWPARSPDLNPIENLWGALVSRVYDQFRQFDTLDDLKEAITFAWEALAPEYLESLVSSMPNRCISVLEKRGGHMKY